MDHLINCICLLVKSITFFFCFKIDKSNIILVFSYTKIGCYNIEANKWLEISVCIISKVEIILMVLLRDFESRIWRGSMQYRHLQLKYSSIFSFVKRRFDISMFHAYILPFK